MYDFYYYYYINYEWPWNECYVYLRIVVISYCSYLSYLLCMYEIATFVLHVHDALMALDFQNCLLVVIQKKKKLPLFFI